MNETIFTLWTSGPGSASRMAEGIALQRLAETMLPEDIRLFSDPYAVCFIDPVKITWAQDHPEETRVLAAELERSMPGWNNAIRGRIRFFDDIVQEAPGKGFTQLVIIGAGYDTRAYRIGTPGRQMRVFEIDRPETLMRKSGIVRKIFGNVPDHVSFVPFDISHEECWDALGQAGWSCGAKALFLLEGLVMYLPRPAVEALLAGIARNAGAGSVVLFDFVPQSLADGTSDAEGGRNIRDWTVRLGEPILSGFADGEVEELLSGSGYSGIRVISSRDFAQRYFTGKRAGRKVSGLMSIASATVPGADRA